MEHPSKTMDSEGQQSQTTVAETCFCPFLGADESQTQIARQTTLKIMMKAGAKLFDHRTWSSWRLWKFQMIDSAPYYAPIKKAWFPSTFDEWMNSKKLRTEEKEKKMLLVSQEKWWKGTRLLIDNDNSNFRRTQITEIKKLMQRQHMEIYVIL